MKQQMDEFLFNLSSSVQSHYEMNNRRKEDRLGFIICLIFWNYREAFHNSLLDSVKTHGSKLEQQKVQGEEALRLYKDGQHLQMFAHLAVWFKFA